MLKGVVMYKLSIVIPVYNSEKYLHRCLDSIAAQTLKTIEVVCVNDGSSDKSLLILQKYRALLGERVVIINKKNAGAYAARLDGINASTGDYVGFVDSDDYIPIDYAEKLYTKADQEQADICICGFDRINSETNKLYSREMVRSADKIINLDTHIEEALAINSGLCNKIFRRSLIKNISEIGTPPHYLDDLVIMLQIIPNMHKIVFTPHSLYYYMVRSGSLTTSAKIKQLEHFYTVILEIKQLYINLPDYSKYREFLDAMTFLHLGISQIYRLSNDKELNIRKLIKKNTEFLDKHFSSWRKSSILNFSYIVKNSFINSKLLIMKYVYQLGLIRPFLLLYNFIINKWGIDIKW
jgi:glycosyltransferase involved in cell wall biosynthesis